jgi:hypothetical protein
MSHPPRLEACDATTQRRDHDAQCGPCRKEGEAKNEEDGRAKKKTQKTLQEKFVEENRRRRSTTFTPLDLDGFQVAADSDLAPLAGDAKQNR